MVNVDNVALIWKIPGGLGHLHNIREGRRAEVRELVSTKVKHGFVLIAFGFQEGFGGRVGELGQIQFRADDSRELPGFEVHKVTNFEKFFFNELFKLEL